MLDLYQSLGRRSKFYRRLRSNYTCLQALVNNAFVNNAFTWKSSCMIANNAQKLFAQGYNLEVHDVIKYTRKHRATLIISRASWFYLRDVISRSRNRLSSPSKVKFTPC